MPSESSRSPIVTADSRLGQDLACKRRRTSVTSAACLGLPRKIGWPFSRYAEVATTPAGTETPRLRMCSSTSNAGNSQRRRIAVASVTEVERPASSGVVEVAVQATVPRRQQLFPAALLRRSQP